MININSFSLKKTKCKKVLLVVKSFLFFFLLSMGICYAKPGYSQETRISLQINNKSLKEVFSNIENQSDFVFFYSDNVIDVNKRVSISTNNETIGEVLNKVFNSTNSTYVISGKQIYVSHKVKEADKNNIEQTQQQKSQQENISVSGIVKDIKGEPLIGVSISVKGMANKGTVTDTNGNFTLEVPQNWDCPRFCVNGQLQG